MRHTHFDGDNYFWLYSLASVMIMHPIKPELEGNPLAELRDPDGKALFVEMVDVAQNLGAGFVEYRWSKPGFEQPVPKISFVKLQPQWGWGIGAGLYVDDLKAELSRTFNIMAATVIAVILLVLLLVFLTARSLTEPMARVVAMLGEMSDGWLGSRLNLNRRDELGVLAETMDRFADDLEHEMVDNLKRLAAGDLTIDVNPRDERDAIRGSLMRLALDLNALVGQVQSASEQIASASGQVAEGSQHLSESMSSSASSMEEVSSSMTEIGSQTKLNAENASQARKLAATELAIQPPSRLAVSCPGEAFPPFRPAKPRRPHRSP